MSLEINVPDEALVSQIYLIRGHKVMIDRDLVKLYGVETNHPLARAQSRAGLLKASDQSDLGC
jgi:hypothetical protein